jgi:hypothetical protein
MDANGALKTKAWGSLRQPEICRIVGVQPGNPVNPTGSGQNARATGGAGILPAANLELRSCIFLSVQDVRTSRAHLTEADGMLAISLPVSSLAISILW